MLNKLKLQEKKRLKRKAKLAGKTKRPRKLSYLKTCKPRSTAEYMSFEQLLKAGAFPYRDQTTGIILKGRAEVLPYSAVREEKVVDAEFVDLEKENLLEMLKGML